MIFRSIVSVFLALSLVVAAAGCDDESKHTADAVADTVADVTADATADATPDAVLDATPDAVPDATPDAVPDATPDAVPDATPDAVADTTPDATPDAVADATPDTVADATPDAVPDAVPDVVEQELNGCLKSMATDLTGQATVSITDISAWSMPHTACIIVSAGTVVSWTGNFTFHPLKGGNTPTPDLTSPITLAGPGVGATTIAVTLSNPGTFPYFCGIHLSSMDGVVYVVE
jgi:plastocyanin